MTGPTVQSIFNRIDRNGDGALTRAEVKKMVEDAKVGGGLLGGVKVNQATDAFMERLDANKDGQVSLQEVGDQLKELVQSLGKNVPGKSIPEIAAEWFNTADTSRDGKLSPSEVKAPVKKALEDAGQSMADLKADIAAKIAVHLLDENRSGQVDRSELDSLAKDIEARTRPAPASVA